LAQEVSRTEEVADRRRANSTNHAVLEVEEHRAGQVLAAKCRVVKHVDAVELRVVAADAVLVAQHLSKLGAHLITSLARLHVQNLARRSSLEAGSTREKKGD
jgi:hypothetical protein